MIVDCHWDWTSPEEALEILKKHFTEKEKTIEYLRNQLREYNMEIEKDKRIQELKEENKILHKNTYFTINPYEFEKIQEWIKEHDTNVHNNPKQYHGASGGGYSYIFAPTAIGTCLTIKCDQCGEEFIVRDGSNF